MKKSIGSQAIMYPTPILIIGTYNTDMKPNVMTAAMGGIVSGVPATLSVSLRKATLTYENIIRNKVFTINIPSGNYVKEIDYMGMVSGRNNDKFLDTGLTAIKGSYVDAPYVEEFPLNLECKLIKIIELGLHTQFIGEIVDVKVSEEMLDEKGTPDIEKIKPIIYSINGKRNYYGVGDKLGSAFSSGKEFKPNVINSIVDKK